MSNERIKELLTELRKEARSASIDADTRSALKSLDADIHRLLDEDTTEAEDLVERARHLEAELAASHPVFERFLREVIDSLVKIGL